MLLVVVVDNVAAHRHRREATTLHLPLVFVPHSLNSAKLVAVVGLELDARVTVMTKVVVMKMPIIVVVLMVVV